MNRNEKQDEQSQARTSDEVATKASSVLRDGRTSDDSKSAGGSALRQTAGGSTSDEVASKASSVLTDEDTGAKSKSVAASVLRQAESDEEEKGKE